MPQNIDTTSGQPIQPVTIVQSGASGGDVSVSIDTSNAAVPIDLQSHLQTTIQTHNAVSVAISSNSTESVWHDTDGFDKIAVQLKNDATISSSVDIQWSNDGSTIHSVNFAYLTGTSQYQNQILDTRARYVRLSVFNNDSALAHTISAWIYLKA